MTYSFNPHRHVKIWLSKNKDTFLNLENRVRLVKMRDINPTDEICFVYDSKLLSKEALTELQNFCNRYNISPKDVQQDILPNCRSDEELKLISIYNDEISHLDSGGNLAVGSDILRWLKPVYELGTYTDFDVDVNTQKLPPTISVEKPLLLNIGSFSLKGDVETLFLNNDTIAVTDSQQALSIIKKIQTTIFNRCSRQPNFQKNFIDQFITASRETLSELLSPYIADIILGMDPSYNTLIILAKALRNNSVREVRSWFIDVTTNNIVYCNNHLISNQMLNFSENQKIKEVATLERAALKQKLGWTNWLLLPKNQYQQIKSLASIEDDNEFLSRVRILLRMMILQNSVVYTTGPGALLSALFDKQYFKKETVNKEIAPFSFANYGLEAAFISKNSLALHASPKTALALLQNTEIVQMNDLSWLQEGQDATAIREQKIKDACSSIPQDLYNMRNKIEYHIKKIQSDLDGCFGFYRQKQRQAKITALQSILGHFKGQSFSVDEFNGALDNYRTKDISASIGRSKTKTLINELGIFSQRTKHYMLIDECGQVNVLSSTPAHSTPK